ncbi:MAG: exodeoxyribonuclease VII small subunit [Bacilli bacterium]|nr:exodeoxyribonuclease VII small subunit [Bacilli bacterium]
MKNKEKELSFEENIKKLEGIVKELESGEVPLDDAINKFTEASSIARLCDEKLKNATDSINKIMNEDGTLKDFKIEE